MTNNEFQQNSKPKFPGEKEKKKKSGAIWVLYILGTMAVLMGLGALYYNYRKDKEKTYIDNPQKGDVYEMQLNTGYYTTARVELVTKDSIYVTYNEYTTDKREGISEIDIDRNYGILKTVYSKKRVENLFTQDSIFAINRD